MILTNFQIFVNPDCDECGGEGVCHYARGDVGFDDVCPKCFPNGYEEDDS